ncbi:MAG: hypothetical protein KDD46_06390 [Bdellovibrionales bacterium]|nr:hypothetical protein [Bdellovibrionales bacterium]
MMKRFRSLLCIYILLWATTSLSQEQETIQVRHQATIESSDDLMKAKEKVKQDALVKGLLQASQTLANPALITRNENILKARFSDMTASFIQDYQFIEQKMVGSQYNLEIKIDPKWYFLKNKLSDWGFAGFQSKPNLIVSPFALNQQENQKITPSGDYWSSKTISYLKSMGMIALSQPTQNILSPFTITTKILRSGGKEVEFVYQVQDEQGQINQQFSESISKQFSEDEMAGLLALSMIEHVMPLWFEIAGNQRVYEVKLQNVHDFASWQEFKKVLASQRGVIQNVQDKKYMSGATVFLIHVLQESLNLSSYLSNLMVGAKKVTVVGQSGRQIIVELQ